MSKNDFLKQYSYLNSEDYFATCKNLFCGKNSKYFQEILVEKLIPEKGITKDVKLLFARYAQSNEEVYLLTEKFFNESISPVILTNKNQNAMKQFYNNVLIDYEMKNTINYPPYKVAINFNDKKDYSIDI